MKKPLFYALSVMLSATGVCGAGLEEYGQPLWNPDQAGLCMSANSRSVVAEAAPEGADINKDGVIVAAEGERKVYTRSGEKYYLFAGFLPMLEEYDSTVGVIVWGDDGFVYIKNIISELPAGSYVKGTLENDKVTLELPQLISVTRENGLKESLYVDRLVKEDFGGFEETFVPDNIHTVTFSVTESGLEMEGCDGTWMLGVIDQDDYWAGYGEQNCTWAEYEENFVTVPENLVTESYLFVADGSSHMIEVGFDNDDVYFCDVFTKFPGRWIKGTLGADNKITLENGQYLGFRDDIGEFTYFMGGVIYELDNGDMSQKLSDKGELMWDPENKRITCDGVLFANAALDRLYYTEMWRTPIIHIQPESYDLTPMDPWYTGWSPWNTTDNWCGIQFRQPALTVDSYSLDPERMYWRMHINDNVFMFDYDEYPQLSDLTEWVPYNTDGLEINNYGTSLHTVILFVEDIETVMVQSLYKAEDGTNYYSNKIVYDVNTGESHVGLDSIVYDDAEIESVTYWTIDGVKVAEPHNGLFVKQMRFKDGRVSSCKVLKK